ncbi:MAG: LAGLIDADG family homing endonuclease, partial [Nanoarchaeota archaeon]
FSSRLLYELFKNYLCVGDKAHGKRIPSLVLNMKKNKLAAFLRGYFEGDGSVSLSDIRVCCDTVSEGLKHDLSFALSRYGIFTKFYEYEKEPGPKVRDFYIRKKRKIPTFKITKIIIPSNFVNLFKKNIGFWSDRKKKILDKICELKPRGMKIDFDENYAYPRVTKIESSNEQTNYCFNVAKEHNFLANDILVHNCDGDEAAVMVLADMLLNFSKHFLPSHRGGTQDAPLVLNTRMRAGEVDDMIFDLDVTGKIPLALYRAAEEHKSPSEIKMERVANRLGGEHEFDNLLYSYETTDLNDGPVCSSYKTLPTMHDKVKEQMDLCTKIRAVDTSDVARLVIERHFIRDIRGNLRKFSQQVFRCVDCNEKFRRPPLVGKCTKCGGKIIFTISEGSIIKYMQAALNLARDYHVSPYLLENLEIVEKDIQSIFGKEKEKQEALNKFF